MTGPSRSSPWGIQRGKEIPETIKTGTKHQNKNKNETKQKTKQEKEKGSKYKENQRGEKTCWKKKPKALVYPCQNQ